MKRGSHLGMILLLTGCSSLWQPFGKSNPASCVDPADPPCGAGQVCDRILNTCVESTADSDGGLGTDMSGLPAGSCGKSFKFATPLTLSAGNGVVSVGTADMNDDQKPDLVTADQGDNTVSTLLGDGNGGFAPRQTRSSGTSPGSLFFFDFDRDGKTDIVVPNTDKNQVAVLRSTTPAAVSAAMVGAAGDRASYVVLADLGNDGRTDYVVGFSNANVGLLVANSTGGYMTRSVSAPLGTNALVVRDFDGDGNPDLALAPNDPTSGTALVALWRGSSGGNFASWPDVRVGAVPVALSTADLNGDGKPDLIAVNQGSNNVSVALGDGQGGFSAARSYVVDAGPSSVVAADLNGDTFLDLAVASRGSVRPSFSVLLGNGQGDFCSAIVRALNGTGAQTGSVTTGDYNKDGWADLALNQGTNEVLVFLNVSSTL